MVGSSKICYRHPRLIKILRFPQQVDKQQVFFEKPWLKSQQNRTQRLGVRVK